MRLVKNNYLIDVFCIVGELPNDIIFMLFRGCNQNHFRVQFRNLFVPDNFNTTDRFALHRSAAVNNCEYPAFLYIGI